MKKVTKELLVNLVPDIALFLCVVVAALSGFISQYPALTLVLSLAIGGYGLWVLHDMERILKNKPKNDKK